MKKFILMTITVLFSPILMASDTGFVTTKGKALITSNDALEDAVITAKTISKENAKAECEVGHSGFVRMIGAWHLSYETDSETNNSYVIAKASFQCHYF